MLAVVTHLVQRPPVYHDPTAIICNRKKNMNEILFVVSCDVNRRRHNITEHVNGSEMSAAVRFEWWITVPSTYLNRYSCMLAWYVGGGGRCWNSGYSKPCGARPLHGRRPHRPSSLEPRPRHCCEPGAVIRQAAPLTVTNITPTPLNYKRKEIRVIQKINEKRTL